MNFLGYLQKPFLIPQPYGSFGYEKDKLYSIRQELQRELDAKVLTVKEDIIQDAKFIHNIRPRQNLETNREANRLNSSQPRWNLAKKGDEHYFGCKLQSKLSMF